MNVEDLAQLLRARKNIQPRFSWSEIGKDNAKLILKAAYIAEVESRSMTYIESSSMTDVINRTAEILASDKPRLGIMFCGTCGNGKTTMVNAIKLATAQLRDWKKLYKMEQAKIDLAIQIRDSREIAELAKDYESFKRFKSQDLIAIEDMGKESAETLNYGNIINPVMELIESRYANQKYTLITTNLTAKQVREKYGNRIADRFNEMLDVIVFEDGSYRK